MVLWNLPNSITIFRFFLVPLIVYGLHHQAFRFALSALLLAAITDGLDGLLARIYGLRTKIGAYLDPLADKFLVLTLFLYLYAIGEAPGFLTACVVLRDVLLIIGVNFFFWKKKPLLVAPTLLGKINTCLELLFLFLVFIRLAFSITIPALEIMLMVCILATLCISTTTYISRGIVSLRKEASCQKHSAP